MEEVYGQGKNAIGQLRSAAVPYAISAIYLWAKESGEKFSLDKIWRQEVINEEMKEYLKQLLFLMNDLIKTYSLSDDYGEFSKKEELWDVIRSSTELNTFMSSDYSSRMLTNS